jgi:hypothetical protein
MIIWCAVACGCVALVWRPLWRVLVWLGYLEAKTRPFQAHERALYKSRYDALPEHVKVGSRVVWAGL